MAAAGCDQQSGEGGTSNIWEESGFKVLPKPRALRRFSREKAATLLIGTQPLNAGPSSSEQKRGKKGRLKAERPFKS